MHDPNVTQPMANRPPTTPLALPPTVLRSAAPKYLLATAAIVAVGGAIAWKVARQAIAIHKVETEAPAVVQVEPARPEPPSAIVFLPAESTGGTTSRVTTTGALLPAPQPAAVPATPPSPAIPAAPVAAVAAPRSISAPHRTHAVHPARATRAPGSDDDNPYDE